MKRRQFIKATAASSVVLPSVINGIPMHAHEPDGWLSELLNPGVDTDHVLVVIYLGGGNDGLNTVIPIETYADYKRVRSNIAIDQNAILKLNGVTKTGLHPAMSGIQSLFNEGKVNIVQSVSYPDPDFSHFRATDIWTSASDANKYISTGWVGRYLDDEYPGFPIGYPSTKDPDPLAVQIGSNLPLMFLGPNAPMSMNISNPDIFKGWPIGINDPATNDARGKELDYIRTVARQSKTYADNLITAYIAGTNSANYPADNYLAEELKAVARLIKGGLKTRMYLVQISGFDTHSDQVVTGSPTTGAHSNLLKLLSDAVLAFQRDLEGLKIDQRVLTMTFSEFGRRIMSNGSVGTDHGVAAPMFVIGKNVQGGIIGKNPDIPTTITVNDNIAMQFDFRSVYSSILKDWFCVSDTSERKVLFNNFQSLPIVKRNCSTIGIEEYQAIEDSVQLNISPNPMTSQCNIQIKVPKGFAQLHLIDPLGRFVKRIFQGKLEGGDHQFKLENENYPPGNYYVHLQLINIQKTEPLIIVL